VRLDGTDNGCYMAVNSEQLLPVKCHVWTTAMIAISWPLLVMAVSNTAKTRITDGRLRRYRKISSVQTPLLEFEF
jgi:hypothetical protein